ncbi:BLUF domain-containing protein [Roseobacter sp. A03A-229]
MLHYVIYQSKAKGPADPKVHNDILERSQVNNRAAELTGFLHREGDFFLQYIEGPKGALHETINRIRQDPRHSEMSILSEGKRDSRTLPDWQMGFVDQDQLSLAELLETSEDRLELKGVDPFDLVVFLAANADGLRHRQAVS